MGNFSVSVGDRVLGKHSRGIVRGQVRAINGTSVHIDLGNGRMLQLSIDQITQINGRKING